MLDIYDRPLEETLTPIQKSNLSEENKKTLMEFRKNLLAQGLSKHRIGSHTRSFRRIDHLIDFNLENAEKEDLKDLAAKINQNDIKEEDYSIWTLNETRKSIRRFYQWHTDSENPEIVDFLRCHVKKSEQSRTDPDELLSPEQAEKIIDAASNLRDKAFLSVLWDSGARIGEILNLQWRDIRFKDEMMGVKIREGKTGGRKIYLVESLETLKEWKEYCEEKKNIEAEDHVFTVHRPYSSTEPLKYRSARKQVQACADRTEVPEYIKTNPHAWRKARATDMASKGMNQPTMNQYFGWSRGSDNPVLYIRLAKRDVENSVKRIYDIE
jgi:integrase